MMHEPPQTGLTVVSAGPGWLVVDKPGGMSVHNDPGRDLCSLAQVLLGRDAALAQRTGFIAGAGVHAPHRLDRDTSGLVVLCCAPGTLRFYGRAFQSGQVGKCYLAVVHGRLAAPGGMGAWSFPLARSGAGRSDPAGRGRRDASCTMFQAIGHSPHYTLAACFPRTGRRHQIRRHAKMAGHPVVGDRRYGSARSLRHLREQDGLTRLGLHAYGLDLPLPSPPERRAVFSPAMPPELVQLLAADSSRPAQAWQAALPALNDPAAWPMPGPSCGG